MPTALMVLLAAADAAGAQDPPPNDSSAVESADLALEGLAEERDGDDAEAVAESLADLRDNPIDVNTADAGELSPVPGIGPTAARAIVARRRAYGPFASLDELQSTSVLSRDALAAARPYLVAGAGRTRGRVETADGRRVVITQRLQARLDLPHGYRGDDSSRAYPGSPMRLYTRAQARLGQHVALNVTLEKDPGETFRGRSFGYDHVSASAGLRRLGRLETLVVGDFVAGFGQGLVLARSAGMGKGSDPTRGPTSRGRGLQPYGSADENRYFRGAGATVAVTPWLSATAFGSRRRRDASVALPDSADLADGDLPPGTETIATSLGGDGLHRTPAELARRGMLRESVGGAAVEARLDGPIVDVRLGAVGYHSRFDLPVAPAMRPDSRFAFRGDATGAVGAFADARTNTYHAFAEVARDAGGAVAAIAGAGVSLAPGSELLVVARRYPREFVSIHGAPFGERNVGQNEHGAYSAARVQAGSVTVSGFADVYRFPWLRFNVARPSTGYEWLMLFEYRPARWLRASAQARGESRDAGADVAGGTNGSVVGGLARERRRTVRLNAEFDASRSLRLRTRVEAARAGDDDTASQGTLVFQDVRYQVRRWLRVDARITLFQTDDFASRLYQLETDVAGAFTLPVLHGRGTRAYVAVTLHPMARLTLQGRLAATFLEDTRNTGSGPDAIDGARVADASVQIRWAW